MFSKCYIGCQSRYVHVYYLERIASFCKFEAINLSLMWIYEFELPLHAELTMATIMHFCTIKAY